LLIVVVVVFFVFAQYLSIPDAWKTNYEGVIAVRVIGGAVPPNTDKLSVKGFSYQAMDVTLRMQIN